MRETKLVLLSVHYRYSELLADQARRIERCIGPTRRAMGLRLEYFPVVHRDSAPEVIAAARAACRGAEGAACIDVRERLGGLRCRPSLLHGESLAAAFAELRERGELEPGDLLALLDHDAHPLDVRAFAALARRLFEGGLAGIGIPQWQRGHCYLHPSLLMTRAATVAEIGPEMAFKVTPAAIAGSVEELDTAEGFTFWCERHRRPRLALRVIASRFPWARWDSDMVPGEGAELTGEHREQVHVGNLMLYGLQAGQPLVSHIWSAAESAPWFGLGDDAPQRIFSAYLAEPLAE
ncbi:MAG TPA: hypothetical protein VHR45_15735 [Thermoanaerobaculia bacterium]|nr:hypothetical protein [Thermoanaerobaculia bacterium]